MPEFQQRFIYIAVHGMAWMSNYTAQKIIGQITYLKKVYISKRSPGYHVNCRHVLLIIATSWKPGDFCPVKYIVNKSAKGIGRLESEYPCFYSVSQVIYVLNFNHSLYFCCSTSVKLSSVYLKTLIWWDRRVILTDCTVNVMLYFCRKNIVLLLRSWYLYIKKMFGKILHVLPNGWYQILTTIKW